MNAAAVSAVFKERIASHAEHVKKVAHICTTEETTKQALILPLLDILGFSAFDPNKVRAEYQADFPGAKSGGAGRLRIVLQRRTGYVYRSKIIY
ncbi:TPA: hypothetical protein ACFB3O_001868 [Neisseria gonorrhoeae]